MKIGDAFTGVIVDFDMKNKIEKQIFKIDWVHQLPVFDTSFHPKKNTDETIQNNTRNPY
ncbi:MAG: hypothetical protein ACI9Y7_001820 [Dokdonia sp.]|jgi:hypothetical protein